MHRYQFAGNLPFGEKYFENIVPEESLQFFQFQRRRDVKHALFTIEASICYEDVAVRIESKEIAEGLHGDNSAGDGIIFRNRILDKTLQRFPGTAAEGGKKFSIIQKVATKNLRDTEDEMPVRNLFEDVHTEPLPEFHYALLMAGWTKMPSFTRKCQQVFMAAIFAFHTGKTVLQIAPVSGTGQAASR